MTANEFEEAIKSLGIPELDVNQFVFHEPGKVECVYANIDNLTFFMWDSTGRAFIYQADVPLVPIEEETEYWQYLNYNRDNGFDLKFD